MTAKLRFGEDRVLDESLLAADPRWKLAQRIAQSSVLARATQLRNILLFIVRQDILDHNTPVRELDIACKVLGRKRDFSPLIDNIVRVQIAYLRKKLQLYYEREGREEETLLSISLGTYKPIFRSRAAAEAEEKEAAPEHGPSLPGVPLPRPAGAADAPIFSTAESSRTRLALWGVSAAAAVLLVLSVVLSVALYKQRQTLNGLPQTPASWQEQPALSALWSNYFDSNRDTDMVIGDNGLLLIENLTNSSPTIDAYLNHTYLTDAQAVLRDPAQQKMLNLLATKNIGSMGEFKLAQRALALDANGRKIHLYNARQYLPTLLRQDNTILVGGRVSNPWQNVYQEKLNFVEDLTFDRNGHSTVTNLSPRPGEKARYESTDQVAYCIIAYLPGVAAGSHALLLEGTDSEATEAAGDFLFSEDQLSAFLKKLGFKAFPPFEVLLKITQVRGSPLTTTIEAYRTYTSK